MGRIRARAMAKIRAWDRAMVRIRARDIKMARIRAWDRARIRAGLEPNNGQN